MLSSHPKTPVTADSNRSEDKTGIEFDAVAVPHEFPPIAIGLKREVVRRVVLTVPSDGAKWRKRTINAASIAACSCSVARKPHCPAPSALFVCNSLLKPGGCDDTAVSVFNLQEFPMAVFTYIWEFIVRPEHMAAFVAAYGPGGDWVRFFSRDPLYLGTELLRDRERPERFITRDSWATRDARFSFRERFRAEYDAIDARCEAFTHEERRLGDFEVVAGHLSSSDQAEGYRFPIGRMGSSSR